MTEDNGRSGRILLLEDEPIIGRVTARTLKADGFEVDIAVNGLVAKDKIAANRYDLFIFDIRTPVMNGIELYEYMEKEHPNLTGRVIFSTGDSLGVATKKFLERVECLYLGKPYIPSKLRAVVREALSKNRPTPSAAQAVQSE